MDNLTGIVDADKNALSLGSGVTAAYDTKNAGTGKTVNYSGLTLGGDKAGNYSLAAEGSISNASITARDITATVADLSPKTYDGQTAVNNVTAILDNTVEGDAISATASGSYADNHVGTDKAVTYNSFTLSGADKDNYNLTTTSYVGKGSITAAPVTFKADDYTKEYDGTTEAPGATYQKTAGEIYGIDTYSGGTFAFENAEPGDGKTLNLSGVTINDGNNGANYVITCQPSTNSKITPKAEPTTSEPTTPEPTTPEPTKPEPATPETVEQQVEQSGVTVRQLEEATNSTTPNVQSNTASAAPVTDNNSPAENTQSASTPEAPASSNRPTALSGEGVLTVENNGVNAPESMNAENLGTPQPANVASNPAEPAASQAASPEANVNAESTGTQENAQQESSNTDNAETAGSQDNDRSDNAGSEKDTERQQNEENE